VWRNGTAGISGSLALWLTAISHAVKLPVHRHHLDKPGLSRAVRRSSDAGIEWINFVHFFTVSFLLFAIAWIARTRLASSPAAAG